MSKEKVKMLLKENLISTAQNRMKEVGAVLLLSLLTLAAGCCGAADDAPVSSTENNKGSQITEDLDAGQPDHVQRQEVPELKTLGQEIQEQKAQDQEVQSQEMQEQKAQEVQKQKAQDREAQNQAVQEHAAREQQDEELELYYEKDGRQYQLVPDLVTGEYIWASVLTNGIQVKDSHGHDRTDYYSQEHTFEKRDAKVSYPVRRWDNLMYSAGEYLVFEYDGIVHVSEHTDLYHPVLSYDYGGTYGIIIKVPRGYMVSDSNAYEIRFYNEKFQEKLVKTGLRAGESGVYFENGRMAVRDMKTGLMGFMDERGELVIPCKYAIVSDFSNGYASVLTDAEVVSYTEDAGTVQMFCGKGGQWGIIDEKGSFVIEPCERFANQSQDQTDVAYDAGVRRFGLVREDGTVDFIASDQNERVLETVSLR